MPDDDPVNEREQAREEMEHRLAGAVGVIAVPGLTRSEIVDAIAETILAKLEARP